MAGDFIVESKGYCFLCLNDVSIQNSSADRPGPGLSKLDSISNSTTHSLQSISRYLEMDMRKVFHKSGPIHQYLIDRVRKSKLKVELCLECVWLNHKFSEYFQKLEKVEMEVIACLNLVQIKLADAEEAGRTEEFRKFAAPEGGWLGKLDILEALRTEAIQKCSNKLSSAKPRLKLRNMKKTEIRRKNPISKLSTKAIIPERLSPDSSSGEFTSKMETMSVKFQHPSESSISDDGDDNLVESWTAHCENEDSSKETIKTISCSEKVYKTNKRCQPPIIVTPRKSSETQNIATLQAYRNPKTGKYKCGRCPSEFVGENNLLVHYKSVHLQIKYKCIQCGKNFQHQSSYSRHYQSVHVGVKFKCGICCHNFTQKSNLLQHQRRSGPCRVYI